MNNQSKRTRAGMAAMAVAAMMALAPSAQAIPLTWIEGPQTGQAFAGGGIQIKAVNYDTGTLYNPLAVGAAVGFGVGGADGSVAAGAASLNAPARVSRPILSGLPGEDSWGILRITNVQATASDGVLRDIYNSAVSPFELTAIFGGVSDFYLTQVSLGSNLPGGGQIIDGTGLRVDIYSDFAKDFSQVPGPGGRVPPFGYPTVTNGVLELSLLSTPGFINANGTLGGAATEFESNTADVGSAALNVTGGASAAQFDTNAVGFKGTTGAGAINGVAGQLRHDVYFSFTSLPGVNGWDITSNDPMVANIAVGVPDAGSSLLMLGMGLVLVVAAYRRRQHA